MRPAVFVALVLSFLSSIGVPGCAEPSRSVPSPSLEPGADRGAAAAAQDAPETTFAELERRLGPGPLRLRFEIAAEGAVVASLAGSLSIADEIELAVAGRFAGAQHDLRLWTEGDRLRAGPSTATGDAVPALDVPRPPELVPALVLGLVRMGLLHNVARLVAGRAPDHAEGGVGEWVRTVEPRHVQGDDAALGYGLEVAGQRSGEGTLWLDAQGLPVRRELVVRFGEGPEDEMRVVERYDWLAPLPAG